MTLDLTRFFADPTVARLYEGASANGDLGIVGRRALLKRSARGLGQVCLSCQERFVFGGAAY